MLEEISPIGFDTSTGTGKSVQRSLKGAQWLALTQKVWTCEIKNVIYLLFQYTPSMLSNVT